MVDLNLKAKPRELGKKADLKAGRRDESIPAVLYGFEQDNTNLWVDGRSAEALFKEVGRSRLLNLAIDGKDFIKVVIKEAQRDPVTDAIIHFDLYRVDLKKPIDIKVPIHFIGEAPAVKVLGGTLLASLHRLEIRCLPEDIIKDVEVDLTVIEAFDDAIHVESLKLPANVEVLTNLETVVATVKPPRVEEEPIVEEVEEGEEGAEEGEEGAEEGEEDMSGAKKDEKEEPARNAAHSAAGGEKKEEK